MPRKQKLLFLFVVVGGVVHFWLSLVSGKREMEIPQIELFSDDDGQDGILCLNKLMHLPTRSDFMIENNLKPILEEKFSFF